MNVLAVEDAAQMAVEKVRTTGRPFFLVCNTYRFRAHSMFDAELYRDKSEIGDWKKRDPIPALKSWLLQEQLINNNEIDTIEKKVEDILQKAVDFAEKGTWEPLGQLTNFIYNKP